LLETWWVFQTVDFSSANDLKFTYMHLQYKKNFLGVITSDPRDKGDGRGREGRGGEGRGREGMRWAEPPKTNPVYGTAPEF
jgi:hypothetical protein